MEVDIEALFAGYPDLMRPDQVARVIGVHRTTVIRWYQDGLISGCVLSASQAQGSTLRIFRASVVEFVRSRTNEAYRTSSAAHRPRRSRPGWVKGW